MGMRGSVWYDFGVATPPDVAAVDDRNVELERGVASCEPERGVCVTVDDVARIPRDVEMGNGELIMELIPMSDCLALGEALTSRLSKRAC